jgi:predicted ATPase
MYFCKMAGGESNLSPLQINDFGRVSNWPDDFFGDEFGEIAAMEKAALKREISRGQPQDGA